MYVDVQPTNFIQFQHYFLSCMTSRAFWTNDPHGVKLGKLATIHIVPVESVCSSRGCSVLRCMEDCWLPEKFIKPPKDHKAQHRKKEDVKKIRISNYRTKFSDAITNTLFAPNLSKCQAEVSKVKLRKPLAPDRWHPTGVRGVYGVY